jgi:hypothetical protein
MSEMKNGQQCRVLIEAPYPGYLRVWADMGNWQKISDVPGVAQVLVLNGPTKYDVLIDARFDPEIVKEEIRKVLDDRPTTV